MLDAMKTRKMGGILGPSIAGTYMALSRLEKLGLVESEWGPATAERGWGRKRLYKLTDKGGWYL
jgi:DNA-binding PadR family transcriptional regulator